jgi:hypothetical protein
MLSLELRVQYEGNRERYIQNAVVKILDVLAKKTKMKIYTFIIDEI